jgi:predicted solute-binding protein
MARERLTIPEQNVRDYAHELAYTLARQQMAAIKDIQQQCRNSSTEYLEK